MVRRAYPSDLSDAQWELVEPLMPEPAATGAPRTTDLREVLDALFSKVRTGCSWRQLPHDFPCWETVASSFYRWKRSGLLRTIHDVLHAEVRCCPGRDPDPTLGIIDSQSVRTGQQGGLAASTRASGSVDANATSWSTRWAC